MLVWLTTPTTFPHRYLPFETSPNLHRGHYRRWRLHLPQQHFRPFPAIFRPTCVCARSTTTLVTSASSSLVDPNQRQPLAPRCWSFSMTGTTGLFGDRCMSLPASRLLAQLASAQPASMFASLCPCPHPQLSVWMTTPTAFPHRYLPIETSPNLHRCRDRRRRLSYPNGVFCPFLAIFWPTCVRALSTTTLVTSALSSLADPD